MLCPKDNVLQQAWYLLLPLLIQRDNCRVSPLVRTTHKSCCCVLQSLAVLTLPLVRLLNHSNWCSMIHAHLHPSFFGRSNTLHPLALVTKVTIITKQAFRTLLLEPK